MNDKKLEKIAEEAKLAGKNDLAIVLYTYLGSEKAGVGSLFAEHCQDFARSGLDWIETRKKIEGIRNRRN